MYLHWLRPRAAPAAARPVINLPGKTVTRRLDDSLSSSTEARKESSGARRGLHLGLS